MLTTPVVFSPGARSGVDGICLYDLKAWARLRLERSEGLRRDLMISQAQ